LLDCPGDSERDISPSTEQTSRGWDEIHYVGSFGKDVYISRKQVAKRGEFFFPCMPWGMSREEFASFWDLDSSDQIEDAAGAMDFFINIEHNTAYIIPGFENGQLKTLEIVIAPVFNTGMEPDDRRDGIEAVLSQLRSEMGFSSELTGESTSAEVLLTEDNNVILMLSQN
jgi:hypothetical protein